MARTEAYPRARAAAERALKLDETAAEAWYARGDVLVEYYWDMPAARTTYERAIQLAAQDADGLRGYGYFLRSAGRADRAVDVYRETLRLDPLSRRGWAGLYRALLAADRFDEAEAWVRDSMPDGTPEATVEGALVFVHEARREFDRIESALTVIEQFLPGPWHVYFNALVQRHNGDVEAGDATIRRVLEMDLRGGLPPNWFVSRYHALFGDFDTALDFLEKAAENREIGLGEALHDRNFAELRKDPRFWDWVSRAGIKPLEKP